MRHPSGALALEFHPVPDSVETELWCPACAAATGVSILVLAVVVLPDELLVLRRMRCWACEDCGRACSLPDPVGPPE